MLGSKVWIDGLVHQVQLMAHGRGIINAPFPIENLKKMFVRQFGNFWVPPCPIYGLLSLQEKGQYVTITFTTTCNYLVFATKKLLSMTIVTSC